MYQVVQRILVILAVVYYVCLWIVWLVGSWPGIGTEVLIAPEGLLIPTGREDAVLVDRPNQFIDLGWIRKLFQVPTMADIVVVSPKLFHDQCAAIEAYYGRKKLSELELYAVRVVFLDTGVFDELEIQREIIPDVIKILEEVQVKTKVSFVPQVDVLEKLKTKSWLEIFSELLRRKREEDLRIRKRRI